MAHIAALVTPSILAWARETAGYTLADAAKKLKVESGRLQDWETGQARPSIAQAQKLAVLYHRPLALFYLPTPPETKVPPPDYRKLSVAGQGVSPRLRFELRSMQYRREVAMQLSAEAQEGPPAFDVHARPGESSTTVADRLRDALHVALETQYTWHSPQKALVAWTNALESLGALVFQTEPGPWAVTEDEMWGASSYEPVFPAILLNVRLAPAAKVFTLMHEYTHLALKTSGICDMDEREWLEVLCNSVAGRLLVPDEPFRADVDRIHLLGPLFNQQVHGLATRYSVSGEVVLRRLLDDGLIPKALYQSEQDRFRREFLDSQAIQRRTKKPGGPPRSRVAIHSNGIRYTGLVLAAYHDSAITLTDVSRYLQVNVKHLGKIEALVSSRGLIEGSR